MYVAMETYLLGFCHVVFIITTYHSCYENYFREEKEKLNIWVALLNLENLYGTQEALLKVFDEALRHNEPIDVFFKLVTIYQNSEKYEVIHKQG